MVEWNKEGRREPNEELEDQNQPAMDIHMQITQHTHEGKNSKPLQLLTFPIRTSDQNDPQGTHRGISFRHGCEGPIARSTQYYCRLQVTEKKFLDRLSKT